MWGVNASRAALLASTLARDRERAFLFRDLATLRADLPLFARVDDLQWQGPTPGFAAIGARFDAARSDRTPRR
jgi:hypothetical protein